MRRSPQTTDSEVEMALHGQAGEGYQRFVW